MALSWPLILAYHDVVPRRASRYAVTAADFERHLDRLMSAGCEPLSLDEALWAVRAAGDERPPTFTLTFDDGYRSFAELVMPILERHGLARASTVFVPTAFVGADNGWRTEPTLGEKLRRSASERTALMSWDEIADLGRAGVSFHSHGHRHLPMQHLSYAEALDDAATSRAALAEHGIDARYLALPYGWHSEDCKRAIRDAGFDGALSVQRGGRDAWEVRRVPVYGTDGAALLRLKLSGRFLGALDAATSLVRREARVR